MQAIHQVRDDEVPELQQLLGNRGSQKACQECQTPEQGSQFKGVNKIPSCKQVRRNEEEAYQFMPLDDSFPHVERKMTVVCEEVPVHKGELPHQEKENGSSEEIKKWLFFQSLKKAKDTMKT